MKYMILLFGDETQWENATEEDMANMMQVHQEFDAWCTANNVSILGGEELQPGGTAKTFTADGTVTYVRSWRSRSNLVAFTSLK